MADQVQNDSDFSAGFLVKGKGGFKKFQDGQLQEVGETPAPAAPVPFTPPAVKSVPPVRPYSQTVSQPAAKPPAIVQTPLAPRPPISVSRQSPVMPEPEDEEDILKHIAQLEKMGPATAPVYADNLINKIVALQGLSFEDETMKRRFFKIMESGINDVRSGLEVTEVLSRPKKIGGMEWPTEMAEKAVNLLEDGLKRSSRPGVVNAPVQAASGGATFAPAPPSFVPRPKSTPPLTVAPAPKPAPDLIQAAQELIKEMPKPVPPANKPMEKLYRPAPAQEMAKIAKARQAEPARPQVTDIKLPTRVMGPIEELGDIDLKEFRRLGRSPGEAADKILEKIYLLEDETWQMRMDGTKAWQGSPLFKLYIEIGQACLVTQQTLDQVLKTREQEAKPALYKEEFMAINDLNHRINI